MPDLHFPKLFSPTQIQGLRLKNRVVALPVFTGYALPDARVSPLMLEHYRRLARSGAALVVIPNVAVAENGRISQRSLLLDHDRHVDGLRRLVGVIKENHALACVQLNHGGRYALCDHPLLPSALDPAEIARNIFTLKKFMESFPFEKRFGLTAHVAKMTAGWTQQMSPGDIEAVISRFSAAALRAVQAGADMIELHGATGYLIAQFLSPRTNRRRAPWGGSPEARMAFALKIIDEIKGRLPERVPIGFRLILDEKSEGGISPRDALALAVTLERHGVAYLSATIGSYESMFLSEVAKELARPGYLAGLTPRLRKEVTIPVIISGRVVSPQLAEKILQQRQADLIGLGRPLLADVEWLHKAQRNEKVIACKNCNTCFQRVVLGQSVICDRWPKVVQDRIRLETRFASRHGYRTLMVFSSIADLRIAREHIRLRVPIKKDIFYRHLFLCPEGGEAFQEAAGEYALWCRAYARSHSETPTIENVFVTDCQDPVDGVMDQLKDNFGFVTIFHDRHAPWKNQLVLKIPPDVVVVRESTHPNIEKILIPCDLSAFTLIQIRVALHSFHDRPDVDFRFVHVAQNPDSARAKWREIIENFELDPSTPLKIIPPGKGSNVAETLIEEARAGQYGRLILGRRGGFARVRRRILGSVSERLLQELPECSFVLVG